MKSLKKDLQGITRALKALTKKTERLEKAADKLEKAQKTKKVKSSRTTAAKTSSKKRVVRKPTIKKAKTLTATEQVLRIIRRSKKGVSVSVLKKKTGFEDRTVRNIVFRASKQGKIKSAGRGIFLAA